MSTLSVVEGEEEEEDCALLKVSPTVIILVDFGMFEGDMMSENVVNVFFS